MSSPAGAIHHLSYLDYIFYYLAFCGSAFRFNNSLIVPYLTGLLMNIFLFILIIRKYYKTNSILFLFILFLIFSAAMTTFFRAADGGIAQALSPRYGLYSQMLFASLWIAALEQFKNLIKKTALIIMIAFAISWQLISAIMFYPEAALRKTILVKYINLWKTHDTTKVINPWIFGPTPDEDITKAISKGIYHP
jgi:hypothetical protein